LHLLPDQAPWYLVGPGLGLLIVGLYVLANRPLGASGAYVQTLDLARLGRAAESWRVWYFIGIFCGGLLVAVLRGRGGIGLNYGALSHLLPLPALIPVLVAAGTLIGYGARWMGGCTSGHGLCGVASLSRGSMVAAGSFFGTALAVTAFLHVATGGAL
jgi:uncharacterized membrane protein YedE/YeeE